MNGNHGREVNAEIQSKNMRVCSVHYLIVLQWLWLSNILRIECVESTIFCTATGCCTLLPKQKRLNRSSDSNRLRSYETNLLWQIFRTILVVVIRLGDLICEMKTLYFTRRKAKVFSSKFSIPTEICAEQELVSVRHIFFFIGFSVFGSKIHSMTSPKMKAWRQWVMAQHERTKLINIQFSSVQFFHRQTTRMN